MFPDTLRLPALTEIITDDVMTWGASDLDRLVSSCYHLQTLSMCCSEGLQLTQLLQLTALTQLWLAGVTANSTVASVVQLSALQGLQELVFLDPCCFTDDAVKSLTALTQLKRLGLSARDDVFSTTMQQQFARGSVAERVCTCHTIANKVGTSLHIVMGCLSQHVETCLSYSASRVLLVCHCMLWHAAIDTCTGPFLSISPQPVCHQPNKR